MTDHRAARAAEYRRCEADAKTPSEIHDLGLRRSRLEALGEWPLEAAAIAPKPAAASTPITPAPAPPAPKPAPAPTGTREERLHRIAAAWGTDERTLEAALDDGTTPDEFAMIASNEALAAAKAREILSA